MAGGGDDVAVAQLELGELGECADQHRVVVEGAGLFDQPSHDHEPVAVTEVVQQASQQQQRLVAVDVVGRRVQISAQECHCLAQSLFGCDSPCLPCQAPGQGDAAPPVVGAEPLDDLGCSV